MKPTRRNFAALLGASAAVPAALAQQQTPAQAPNPNTSIQQGRGQQPPPPDPFAEPIQFTRKYAPVKARPFPMTHVRLVPGTMFHDAQEWNRGYMSRLPADRLLYNFRANAGLPVGNTEPYGGWEQKDDGTRASELRGHFTGHFLSASA